jgi:zinc protease
MNKNLSVTTVFAIIASVLFAQVKNNQGTAKLVEKVVKQKDEIVIPYEKYVLPNGLTLIVHEDHSDPICHIEVTYHVGSNREQVGRSGFAHFFEHMMFQGSDNVADEEHFKIVTESGGSLNGTTTVDRTNYFETLPSNQLEIGLWLEADRMGFLLDAVTQQKFEVQRKTVKNERGQNYDNRPYGMIFEKTGEALYPVGHPYSWPTIGYIEDLNRVDVNDLKKFFLRWYGPNNAVVVVAGDVNPKQVVSLVEKYYGSILKCPEVKPLPKTPVTLDKDRFISYEDNIRFPMLMVSVPTVPNFHPDEAPLDILADILGGNKSSIFYQNFEKTQLALQSSVNHPTSELSGRMQFVIVSSPKFKLAQMDSVLKISLQQFEKRGVTDEDLQKYKINFEKNLVQSLQSVAGKASQISQFWYLTRNPNYIKKYTEAYKKVTKEDVLRVYNKYVKSKAGVYLSVYPKGKPEYKLKEDNFKYTPVDVTKVKEGDEYKNLVYNKAKDDFDRSKKPMAGTNPVVKVPDYWMQSFGNGLKMIGSYTDEVPMVTMQISIECGHRFEQKEKSGTAQLLASILNESTQKYTSEQMSEELEKLGSEVDISAGNNEITITINCLKKNIDATLKLVNEIMFAPKFDAEEFERSKNQILEGIANQVTQAATMANNTFFKLLYGNDHIMSIPSIGTMETVKGITLDDVKMYYKQNWVPSISSLVVVGDVTQADLIPKLVFLQNWAGDKVVRMPQAPSPKINKTKIFLVDKSKAPQSEVRMGYLLDMPYDATGEFYRATLMNYVLGGAFNSRINLNLREDKGWTYGSNTSFNSGKFAGPFMFSAGVIGNSTDSSIVETIKEMKDYAGGGISPEELIFTKNSIGQRDALRYETPGQKAAFLKRILDYGLEKTFVEEQNKILANMTKEEIDALAKKYLDVNSMVITVTGDKEKILEPLQKLGYEVIVLDSDGNPVKKEEPKEEMKKDESKPNYEMNNKDKKKEKKKK